MIPIKISIPQNTLFKLVVYAEDQPEYLPLPVLKHPSGKVISCWKLNFKELIRLIITRRLYIAILTFNSPLQPLLPSVRLENLFEL